MNLFLSRRALQLVRHNAALQPRDKIVARNKLQPQAKFDENGDYGKLPILPLHVWVYLISDTERRRIIARRFDWCASMRSRIPLRNRTVSTM
jgi:hypothetical protein